MAKSEDGPNPEDYLKLMEESGKWATLDLTIGEIAEDVPGLVEELKRFEPLGTSALLAAMQTVPQHQPHCIRFEILTALVLAFSGGKKVAKVKHVASWFESIANSRCVWGEDLPEDVFVSLVIGSNASYRVLEGVWESAGFYTQRVLDVVETMPDSEEFAEIKRVAERGLVLADFVCEKAGLERYQVGSEEPLDSIQVDTLPEQKALLPRVTIGNAELAELGLAITDIEPLLLERGSFSRLPGQRVGESEIEHKPFVVNDEGDLIVVSPTSITVAVRNFVIARIQSLGYARPFDSVLAGQYSRLIGETPLLGGKLNAPLGWKKIGDHRISAFAYRIDHGRYISFHLYLHSILVHDGFKHIFQDDGPLTIGLQQSIDDSMELLAEQPDFEEGMAIIAGCGWGKGTATKVLEIDNPQWRVTSISAADLVRLSWLDEMKPEYFWRLQDGLESVTKAGVQIVNPNGILNLIGWVRSNDGNLFPHDHFVEEPISPETPLMLALPLNMLRDVRRDADAGYDRHSLLDNAQRHHVVQRVSPSPLFSSHSSNRIYASVTDLESRKLTTVYEGQTLNIWVSIDAPNISNHDTTYRLFEMSNEWLHRIGNRLESGALVKEVRSVMLTVEFLDEDISESPRPSPSFDEMDQMWTVRKSSESFSARVSFAPGYLYGFGLAENHAERVFVRAVLSGIEHVCGSKEELVRLDGQIVTNEEARSFHIFHAHRFTDYVRGSLTLPLVDINMIDHAEAKIGLGLRALAEQQSSEISGKAKCTKYLSRVVDVLIDDIISRLRLFDRRSTLERLLWNNEKAAAEGERWKITSAAVLGLHGENATQIYAKEISRISGAGVCSRILIEMAVCECPLDSQKRMSDIELSKLIARASLLAGLGGLSDAIHFNALEPKIAVSALGDVLFRDEFGELVVEPMLRNFLGRRFITEAPRQAKRYSDFKPVESSEDLIEEEFQIAWEREVGFTIDDGRRILDEIEDYGIKEGTAVFQITTSVFLELISKAKISTNKAQKFLDRFSLSPREAWSNPGIDFLLKDIYPWRYGRRLSFALRPILRLDNSVNPDLLVAPASLRSGFAYFVDGTYSGRLDQSFYSTPEMRDLWWGKASEGHTFNSAVARDLEEAGWTVRDNIELTEILAAKLDRDYGDVDVLAWKENSVLIVECKDLSLARNYSEVAALLANYQGVTEGGKRDSLRKHLDRVEKLKLGTAGLSDFVKIVDPKVHSCLICSGSVPMQFAKIEALEGTFVGSVEELLNDAFIN